MNEFKEIFVDRFIGFLGNRIIRSGIGD